MPKANEIIGPYRLLEELGSGQFGVVWKAERHQARGPRCAIKFPRRDEIDVQEMLKEADVWVQASGHPNVLPLIEASVYDNRPMIVSEYAQDGTLLDWLRKHGGRAPTVESAAEMMDGVLRGMRFLHSRGVVHRDLKPANILLQDEIPRLADFGLSRVLTNTHSTTVAGTLAYMAPEAFHGERTQQTDIWAAGVILYQLLSGRLPFPQRDHASLIHAILNLPPHPLPSGLPASLQEVVMRAMGKDKDSARRFQSAEQMRQALREALREAHRQPLLNERGSNDRHKPDDRRSPENLHERQTAAPEIQRFRVDLPEKPQQKRQARGRGIIAAAGVVALLIGSAIYVGSSSSSSPAEPTPGLTPVPTAAVIPRANQPVATTKPKPTAAARVQAKPVQTTPPTPTPKLTPTPLPTQSGVAPSKKRNRPARKVDEPATVPEKPKAKPTPRPKKQDPDCIFNGRC
jgi:serine/threonine protein kinase